MPKSKLAVCELPDGDRVRYYVRKIARTLQVAGPIYDTVDEAFAQLRKCEQDDEYLHWAVYYGLGFTPDPEEERRHMRNMSKYEVMVLKRLFEVFDSDQCVQTFQSLSDHLQITIRQAKTACRALKRRGWAEHCPYWDGYDGLLGGSGYTISIEGLWEVRTRQRALPTIWQTSGSAAELAASPSPSE